MKMTNKEYRLEPAVSRSELWNFHKSPMHFLAGQMEEHKSTPALVFGSLAHKLVLEPDDFETEYAVMPEGIDRRTKAGKEIYEDFLKFADGKEIVSAEDFEKASEMAAAVREHPIAKELVKGLHEESFFWTDSDTNIPCKIRPDGLTVYEGKPYIIDYKTTDSCEDGHFERSVKKYGYKLQAGMYCEGMFQQNFDEYGFAFIAQEKNYPFAVRVYFCSREFIAEGYDQFRAFLGELKWCTDNHRFYGYEGRDGMASVLYGEDENDD